MYMYTTHLFSFSIRFIVLASFVLYMLSMGITKSFGVLYKELLDTYGYSAGATAFVGSLSSFIQSIGGTS